jgi:cyclomaltodextrin glucanotransferase
MSAERARTTLSQRSATRHGEVASMRLKPFAPALVAALALAACATPPRSPEALATPPSRTAYYGTLEPFASEAVYFVVTDRFVNGDTGNDHRDQGGAQRTFDIPLHCPDGVVDNIGYLGGDFRGLLDHAGYIREMGFGAVWITPVVDNPDEAFSGGDAITCTSFLTDRGKAGYHGYWGVNFHRLDEHLPSPGLGMAELTRGLRAQGLKTVLDIVGNHSSPAFSMPRRQPGFGQVFDANGTLVADHENLPPEQLDPVHNPLHRFYNTKRDLAQLGDFDADNPAVMDHLVDAYLHWIDAGVDAFRIDTIRHQPLAFWKTFSDRIRARHPGFFMFAEAFDEDATKIAPFTWRENGSISVLDFPMKAAMKAVFSTHDGDYAALVSTLHLTDGVYANAYDLATFYDNHDMARFGGDDAAFIDLHHWLFTARGIPVVYYGSEMGFMRGAVEHHGNRNYFGTVGIAAARAHPIRAKLARIAQARRVSIALQRGLQLNLDVAGDTAAFYRVYDHAGTAQTALVLLNKGSAPATFALRERLQPGMWRDAFGEQRPRAFDADTTIEVGPHDAAVWILDGPVTDAALRARLDQLMAGRERRTNGG